MPRAKVAKSDPHRFDDLLQEFGPITLRRFFGGEGICSGEIMIGMIFADTIYFKTDETTRKAFVAEKTKPFTFLKRGTGETIAPASGFQNLLDIRPDSGRFLPPERHGSIRIRGEGRSQ